MQDAIINAIYFLCIIILFGRVLDIFISFLVNLIASFFGTAVAFFVANILSFIGVVHHELSHALFAFLTGAKVTEIKLFTLTGGNCLGYVKFAPRGNWIFQSIQLCVASIAPMITGFISVGCLYHYYLGATLTGFGLVFFWYLLLSIILHMRLSTQDIKVASQGLPVCFVLLVIIFYVTGINVIQWF